jgi:hypothetical protein
MGRRCSSALLRSAAAALAEVELRRRELNKSKKTYIVSWFLLIYLFIRKHEKKA